MVGAWGCRGHFFLVALAVFTNPFLPPDTNGVVTTMRVDLRGGGGPYFLAEAFLLTSPFLLPAAKGDTTA